MVSRILQDFTPSILVVILTILLISPKQMKAMTMSGLNRGRTSFYKNHRIELFFKNDDDLRERVRFLKSHGFQAFNLVNKNQKDQVENWVKCILDEFPEADVCAHYSLKYNKVARKGVEEHSKRLRTFLQSTQATEVLLVSGSGKKTTHSWNTIQGLNILKTPSVADYVKMKHPSTPQLAVAYNPYFPDPSDQATEDDRLDQKLKASNKVHKVYLQFGTDLVRLKQALERLHKHHAETTENNRFKSSPPLAIAGSLFLPTARLIAQQKFRPWNGVFLSPDFLSSPENAQAIVVEMMKLYQEYGVEMLWEAPGIRTEKDLKVVFDLMVALEESSTVNEQDEEETIKTLVEGSFRESSSGGRVPSNARKVESELPTIQDGEKPSKRAKRSDSTCILVFGSHDVRLRDNRAVEQALQEHTTVVPVFLWTKQGPWGVTGALEVVLKDALRALQISLRQFDLELICRNCDGHGDNELLEIIESTKATAVYWNREHTPEGRVMEKRRKDAIYDAPTAVEVVECQSSLLYDPDLIELETGFHGGHWGTLMPFLKNCKKHHGEPSRPTPYHVTFSLLQEAKGPNNWPFSISLDELKMAQIHGKDRWDEPIRKRFPMSEDNAKESLDQFIQRGLRRYESERSRADKDLATSQLSPHLRIGTISPNELYWRTEESGLKYEELKTFSRRLFWRDLAYYQLKCFPDMRASPIRKHYQNTEWVSEEEEKRRFEAWKLGKTGFPIVDAAMRELYETGWMTQSIRMVVASFLVEYLRVNWVKGCEWFHYTLVDSDSAINAMMWNNAGKSGIDQWNFVLSPVTASQDPSGSYTRKWVPELADLPTIAAVHRPWEVPEDVLRNAGVILGETYPHRIVSNLKEERTKSIESTLQMRRQSQHANTERGYDVIRLPNGKDTVVFTKKEYRIDEEGRLLKDADQKGSKSGGKRRNTKRKNLALKK